MSRLPKLAFPLLATLVMAAVLAPSAAANPCAAPCGSVRVVFDCVTWHVTAEGASTLTNTVWTLRIVESTYGWQRVTNLGPQTGPAAAFQHNGIAAFTGGYYEVAATLYANGDPVAWQAMACI